MPNGIDPTRVPAAVQPFLTPVMTPEDQVALLRRIQESVFPVVEGFTGGRPGESPLTRAALQVFQEQTLPIIQQQFQLQGLQGSPALGIATGRALSSTLVPLIQEDLRNRLQAAGLPIQVGGLSAEFGRQALQERLSQAEIASREAMLGRQLTAQEQAQLRELATRQAEQTRQLEFGRQTALGEFGGISTLATQELLQREQLAGQQIAAQERMLGRQLTTQEQAQLRELAARWTEQTRQLEFGRQTALGEFGGTPTLATQELLQREQLAGQQIAAQERMLGRQLTMQEKTQIREIAAHRTELGERLQFGRETAIGEIGGVPTVQRRFGEEQLTQSAAQLAAQIAGAEQQRGLQGLQLGGQLILGLTDPLRSAAQLGQARQELALRSIGAGGELQRSIAQETLDRAQAEFLRRQALSEAATTGLFGGVVLPTIGQATTTTQSRPRGGSTK